VSWNVNVKVFEDKETTLLFPQVRGSKTEEAAVSAP
jgi:hypothetical protein